MNLSISPRDKTIRINASACPECLRTFHFFNSGGIRMVRFSAFTHAVSRWCSLTSACRPRSRLLLLLAATLMPAMLLSGVTAGAEEMRCPRGTHESWGHCCPKGADWNFFKCVQPERTGSCPIGEEMRGGACWPISCPIGEEVRGGACWRISCPMGTELQGSSCVPVSSSCPIGQTGSPPFCN
jgi:hypothetical protein